MAPFSQAPACQEPLRSDGDLSELIRNPPRSIFVLMPQIVKRMTSDSDRTWQDPPSVDVPKALLLVVP
jgi:hypothetical protein